MTLREKIGQMLVFGWVDIEEGDGLTVNPHAASLIDEMFVGGLILMNRNMKTITQLRAVTDAMQQKAQARGLSPLFVAVDQEGGRDSRFLPPEFTNHPSAWEIGETGNPDYARQIARTMGEELLSVGINWDFAPVLDVNNNPDNPIIGHRSYGADPQLVTEMGVAAVHGFQDDAGILSCGKHFPGHGDTDVDSHKALPRVPHSMEHLRAMELVPFQAAMAAGLAAIMTAHIVFPALDPNLPATLSPAVLTGLLREEMGFDGLIITDCLEMNGVADGWGAPEAAVLAAIAGADLLLCCHTLERQRGIQAALVEAVETGRLSEAQVDAAVARIQAAKKRWLTPTTPA